MSLVITQPKYTLAEEGLHQAKITAVKDLGLMDTQYGKKEKVSISFEMQDQVGDEGNVDAGKAVVVNVFAAKSLNSKSTLYKLLSQLGVSVAGSFDLNDIVGLTPQVVIEHNKSTDGAKTYSNIASIVPPKRSKKTVTDEI